MSSVCYCRGSLFHAIHPSYCIGYQLHALSQLWKLRSLMSPFNQGILGFSILNPQGMWPLLCTWLLAWLVLPTSLIITLWLVSDAVAAVLLEFVAGVSVPFSTVSLSFSPVYPWLFWFPLLSVGGVSMSPWFPLLSVDGFYISFSNSSFPFSSFNLV